MIATGAPTRFYTIGNPVPRFASSSKAPEGYRKIFCVKYYGLIRQSRIKLGFGLYAPTKNLKSGNWKVQTLNLRHLKLSFALSIFPKFNMYDNTRSIPSTLTPGYWHSINPTVFYFQTIGSSISYRPRGPPRSPLWGDGYLWSFPGGRTAGQRSLGRTAVFGQDGGFNEMRYISSGQGGWTVGDYKGLWGDHPSDVSV